MAIRREVDDVEKKVLERETMEMIKRDEKERLKMNESLMASLLKLDSVRGVDGCVRVLRKAVIRNVLMLLEKIDSLSSAIDGCSDKFTDASVAPDNSIDITHDSVNGGEIPITYYEVNNGVAVDNDENVRDSEKSADTATDNNAGNVDVDCENFDGSKVSETEVHEEAANPEKVEAESWECVGEEAERKSDFINVNEEANNNNGGGEDLAKGSANDEWLVVGRGDERKRRQDKALEKLAESNQKLVAMVTDLCDKNAKQASLISSLSQRVEQLEKAMNERSLRKKKRKNGGGKTFIYM